MQLISSTTVKDIAKQNPEQVYLLSIEYNGTAARMKYKDSYRSITTFTDLLTGESHVMNRGHISKYVTLGPESPAGNSLEEYAPIQVIERYSLPGYGHFAITAEHGIAKLMHIGGTHLWYSELYSHSNYGDVDEEFGVVTDCPLPDGIAQMMRLYKTGFFGLCGTAKGGTRCEKLEEQRAVHAAIREIFGLPDIAGKSQLASLSFTTDELKELSDVLTQVD